MSASDFVDACREIGSSHDLVQGGGGNISLKTGRGMLVKASGIRLCEVSASGGFVSTDFESIRNFIAAAAANRKIRKEKNYMDVLKNGMMNGAAQPSMETGFHSVLGSAVVHTHPVAVNSLTCAAHGRKLCEEAFGKDSFEWVEYATPGVELSVAILRASEKSPGNSVILLENHGLIVHGESLGWCVKKTTEIEALAESFLREKCGRVFLSKDIVFEKHGMGQYFLADHKATLGQLKKTFFHGFPFPDSAVYYPGGIGFGKKKGKSICIGGGGRISVQAEDERKALKILEVLKAHFCILLNIAQFGKPRFIAKEKAAELSKMEAENIRVTRA